LPENLIYFKQRAMLQAGEDDSFILPLSGVTPGELDTDL
jgi:hypothetical protein